MVNKAVEKEVNKEVNREKAEKYIVLFIIIATVLFSLSQTIIYYLKTPPGFSFQFAHNFIEDYYYYLSIMRQGWQGNWLATSWLTSEVYPGKFVVPFFLFLGHLSRIFNLSLPIVYTIARAIGGIILIGLIWVLIKAVYPKSYKKRLLSLIFVCFGTSWWTFSNGQIYPSSLVRDWTELDPIFRLTFIPHHLASKVFMVLSFIFIFKLSQSSKASKADRCWAYLGLIVSIILMGFTNPVTISTFLPVIVLWLGLLLAGCYLIPPPRGNPLASARGYLVPPKAGLPGCLKAFFGARIFLPFISAIFIGLLVALYHRMIQNTVFPWTSYLAWEKVQYRISIVSYLESLGPLFVFFLIGIPSLLKRQFIGSLLITWVAAGWILLFLIGPLLPLTNSRYLGGYQFIPIGIGAVEGLWILGGLSSKIMQKAKSKKQNDKVKCKKINQIIIWVLTIGLFGYFITGLSASWRQQIYYVKINQNNPQVYLPNQLLDALKFLDGQKPSDTVILAPYFLSTMIPAFTGGRAVAGHQMMTQNSSQKREAIDKFFSYPKEETAEQILRQHNVSYVIFPKEKLPPLTYLLSLHLSRIYENKDWEVVKVER